MSPGATSEKLIVLNNTHSDMSHHCDNHERKLLHDLDNMFINNSTGNDPMDFRIIKDLSLCALNITCLPNNFAFHLNNLLRLDLSNNKIHEIPYSFHLLNKLEQLSIQNNQLSALPYSFGELKNLKTLILASNQIVELSETFGGLRNLETLDLSSNKLNKLPISCAKLDRLSSLTIAENKFKNLPECLASGMKNLSILDVSGNLHMLLHLTPSSIQLSKFIAMKNGESRFFPQWLLSMKYNRLKDICLDGTTFKYFHLSDEKFSLQINNLSVAQSNLSDTILGRIVANMTKLETLNIGNNDKSQFKGNTFWKMPLENLRNPKFLKEINMKGTGLPSVSALINQFCNIVRINLGFNNISWLPEEFSQLKKLEVLILNNNSMVSLPDNIGDLESLRELWSRSNHLSILPDSVKKLKNLKILDLYDNDFEELPEMLGEINSLEGFDVDQNFLDICSLRIRNNPYENLREILRKHSNSGCTRWNGAKMETVESDGSCSTYSLYSSFSDIDSPNRKSPVQTTSLHYNRGGIPSEENWDLSDDSTDEFEPNVYREPRIRPPETQIPLYRIFQNYYCPAEDHSKSVKEMVAEMRAEEANCTHFFEEGQFDDA